MRASDSAETSEVFRDTPPPAPGARVRELPRTFYSAGTEHRIYRHGKPGIYRVSQSGRDGKAPPPRMVLDFTPQVLGVVEDLAEDEYPDRVLYSVEVGGHQARVTHRQVLNGDVWARFPVSGHSARGMTATLADAVLELAKEHPRAPMYRHTGWAEIDGRPVYITAGACVGADGPVPGVETDLGERLDSYALPEPPTGEDETEAVAVSLALLELGAPEVTVPLLAMTYLPVLGLAGLRPNFLGVFSGDKEAGKSVCASLALAHYGPRGRSTPFPGNFSSTRAALESYAHNAKDALQVVDDCHPASNAREQNEINEKFEYLARSSGNGSARGRSSRDGRDRKDKPPRGFTLATAELRFKVSSAASRAFTVPMREGQIDRGQLSGVQMLGEEGVYAQAMAGYVRHLAALHEGGQLDGLALRWEELRRQLPDAGVSRTSGHVAYLLVSFESMLGYARHCGAVTEDRAAELWVLAWQVLTAIDAAESASQVEMKPAVRWVELLRRAFDTKQAYVTRIDGTAPDEPLRWGYELTQPSSAHGPHYSPPTYAQRPGARKLGDISDDCQTLYLEPGETHALLTSLASRSDNPLNIDERALHERLAEIGVIRVAQRGGRIYRTHEVRIGNNKPRRLWVLVPALDGPDDTGEGQGGDPEPVPPTGPAPESVPPPDFTSPRVLVPAAPAKEPTTEPGLAEDRAPALPEDQPPADPALSESKVTKYAQRVAGTITRSNRHMMRTRRTYYDPVSGLLLTEDMRKHHSIGKHLALPELFDRIDALGMFGETDSVEVVGPYIGGTRQTHTEWLTNRTLVSKGWELDPYTRGAWPSVTYRHKRANVEIDVRMIAEWLGDKDSYDAEAACAAMALLGEQVAERFGNREGQGAGLLRTPGYTGKRLWERSMLRDQALDPLPEDVAEVYRTLPQGRIQFLTTPEVAARGTLNEFAYLDGKFMYGAFYRQVCAGPVERDALDEIDPYDDGVVRATVTVPKDWHHVGLLPWRDESGAVHWPDEPGREFTGWFDSRSTALARSQGWHVSMHERALFHRKPRGNGRKGDALYPLRNWGDHLTEIRARLEGIAAASESQAAKLAAGAARNIYIHAIGGFRSAAEHMAAAYVSAEDFTDDPDEIYQPLGDGTALVQRKQLRSASSLRFERPEFAAQVWAHTQRAMLVGRPGSARPRTQGGLGVPTGALHVPRADLLGVHTDALYLARDPHWPTDPGPQGVRNGTLRVKGRLTTAEHGPLAAPCTLDDLFELSRRAEGARR